jgi:acyl dehydratase
MNTRLEITAGQELSATRWTLSQRHLDLFGRVSGSNGRIHVDPAWATPRFGGTVAQGMLLLSPVVRRMEEVCGEELWAAAGRIEARFVGHARPGDIVISRLVVDSITESRLNCSFSCVAGDGRTVVVGAAAGTLSR